ELPATIISTTSAKADASVQQPTAKDAMSSGAVVVDPCCWDWSKYPRYPVIPRPGNFYVPPTGCGYYSLSDFIHGDSRETPPKNAYPAFCIMPFSFFDADFRYVDDPKYNPDFFERLHRIHLGEDWLFGTGGQAQWRHMHEFNSRLTGKTNDY